MATSSKRIFTSYFAKAGFHPMAYAITVMRPAWMPRGRHVPELAPSQDMLIAYKRQEINHEEYTRLYLERLKKQDPVAVAMKIPDGAVLLCYEGPGKFCHRHLAAQWLRDGNPDLIVEEMPCT